MNKTAFRQQHCNQTLTPPLKWSNQHWLGKPVPIIVILETQRPKSRIPKPYEKVSIFHWIGKKNHQKNTKKKSKGRTFQDLGKAAAGKFSRHERIYGIKLRSEIASKNADDITCRERERDGVVLFALEMWMVFCISKLTERYSLGVGTVKRK